MTFADFKARQSVLEAEYRAAVARLDAVSGERGPMGLTPDAVKATPEWQAARKASDGAFAVLRVFNGANVPIFKAEIEQERNIRRGC